MFERFAMATRTTAGSADLSVVDTIHGSKCIRAMAGIAFVRRNNMPRRLALRILAIVTSETTSAGQQFVVIQSIDDGPCG